MTRTCALAGAHLLPDGTVEMVSEFQGQPEAVRADSDRRHQRRIKGCPKYGEVAARKALAECHTEQSMWEKVLECYLKSGLDGEFALAQARCARILRTGEYDLKAQTPVLWNPPVANGNRDCRKLFVSYLPQIDERLVAALGAQFPERSADLDWV